MAANRSAIGISAVGTSMRITEKALAPDDSVRVLTAIDARRASVGLPISMWYFEAASAAAVMNAVLSVPPSRAAASFVSRNGGPGDLDVATQRPGRPQRRPGLVGVGELRHDARGTCRRPRCRADGRLAGSASSSRTCRAMPMGSRRLPAMNVRTPSPPDDSAGSVGVGLRAAASGGRVGRVAFEVEVLQRELDAAARRR